MFNLKSFIELQEIKFIVSDDYKFNYLLDKKKKELENNQDLKTTSFVTRMFAGFTEYSRYRIFLYTMISILSATKLAGEIGMVTWFVYYVKQKYNASVLFGTCILAYCSFVMIIVSIFFSKLRNKMQLRKDVIDINDNSSNTNYNLEIRKKYWFHSQIKYDFKHYCVFTIIIACIIRIIVCIFVIPTNLYLDNIISYKYTYWIWFFIFESCLSVSMLSCNIMLIPLNPHSVTGQFVGLKSFLQSLIIATGTLIVGLLWDYGYNWLWYCNAIYCTITLILIVIIALFESSRFHEQIAQIG